jgi:acyl-coenzyme A thioesterase PaaI-like protein
MTFAEATAVRVTGEGTFDAEIVPGWDIAGNANGGYLLTIAGRAMAAAANRPDPVTVTAHYLAPGRPGPVTIDAEVVKAGKRFTTVSATLAAADGRALLAVLGTFGDLAPTDGESSPKRLDVGPPELPPVEDCVPLVPGDTGMPPPFASNVDIRMHPDDAGFSRGRPSGQMRVRGWFRLPEEQPIDTLALVLATDAYPPTIFNADLPVAWTPTVELTTHLRARPAPGWLRCEFTTRFVTGGFLEEDGVVWDGTGTLVAQSRQLALVPRG